MGLHRAGVGRGRRGRVGRTGVVARVSSAAPSPSPSRVSCTLGRLGRSFDVHLMDGEERVAGPIAVGVCRAPAFLRFVDIKFGEQEGGARVSEPGIHAGTTPNRHVGAQVFGVGIAEYWLYDQPAVWAVVQDGRDREREHHGSVVLAR